MSARVATPRGRTYLASMPAFSLVRLLAMLALLLMPLAMAGQSHAVAAAPHHGAEAAAHGHHGEEPQPKEGGQDGVTQCMMACAALPAAGAAPADEPQAPRPSLFAPPILPISGLAPEAATPPPRSA